MAKSKRSTAKKKAITLAKKIRRQAEGKCERCGKIGKLDGAHIIPVEFEQTAADLDNILCLCVACHTFGKEAAHNKPVSFVRWLDDYAPGLYEQLRKRANVVWPYQLLKMMSKRVRTLSTEVTHLTVNRLREDKNAQIDLPTQPM